MGAAGPIPKNDVWMTVSGNPGTGTVTLGSALNGYQAFSVVGNGNTCDYQIYDCDSNGNRIASGKWEYGISSTYTSSGTTLSRSAGNVIDGSSGAGTLVNFSSGTQAVYLAFGTAWWNRWYGPISQLTDPNLQTWSWLNQGSATVVAGPGGGLYLSAPSNGSGYNWRARLLSSIATPYTIAVCALPLPYIQTSSPLALVAPLLVYDGTKLTTFGFFAGNDGIEVTDWSSVAGYTNSYGPIPSISNNIGYKEPRWWQFNDDGTNHTFSTSTDGTNFSQYYQRSRTAYLSGSGQQVGYGVNPYNQTEGITLLSWKQS